MGLPYAKWLDGSGQSDKGLDAYDLFHDWSIESPKQAAARIQGIIDSVEAGQ
jgi:hypothetical protein